MERTELKAGFLGCIPDLCGFLRCFYLHKSISKAPVHSDGSAVYALYDGPHIWQLEEAWIRRGFD
jgi:hypothetical protein